MNTGFKDQPAWFTGVVEDINDPSEMGRLKVRCFGYHTPEKDIDLGGIPTSHLPWAHVMMPINGASMSGIGQSATGVLQGSWVIGFFRDGEALQDPFVIGSLPSMSTALPAITNGFNDPDGGFPLTDLLGESDMSRAARTEYAAAQPYVSKEDTRQELIETATPPRVTSISPDKEDTYYERLTWENRKLEEIINPTYPANHVHESESGHIKEIDDTPNYERLSTFHTSGTYEEIVANGDKTVTVVGDEYEVTFKSKNMYVKGNVNLTVDGDMKTLVKGNYHLEVEGDKTEYIKRNRVSKLGLNELIEVGSLDPDEGVPSDRLLNVSRNNTTRIGGNEIRDVVKDSTTNITGNYNMNIVLDSKTVVSGHAAQTVIKTFAMNSIGELSLISNANMNIATNAAFDLNSKNDITIAANNPDKVEGASGSIDIDGSRIDLN